MLGRREKESFEILFFSHSSWCRRPASAFYTHNRQPKGEASLDKHPLLIFSFPKNSSTAKSPRRREKVISNILPVSLSLVWIESIYACGPLFSYTTTRRTSLSPYFTIIKQLRSRSRRFYEYINCRVFAHFYGRVMQALRIWFKRFSRRTRRLIKRDLDLCDLKLQNYANFASLTLSHCRNRRRSVFILETKEWDRAWRLFRSFAYAVKMNVSKFCFALPDEENELWRIPDCTALVALYSYHFGCGWRLLWAYTLCSLLLPLYDNVYNFHLFFSCGVSPPSIHAGWTVWCGPVTVDTLMMTRHFPSSLSLSCPVGVD